MVVGGEGGLGIRLCRMGGRIASVFIDGRIWWRGRDG